MVNTDDPGPRIADEESADTLAEAQTARFIATAMPPTAKQMMRYTRIAIAVTAALLTASYTAMFLIGALLGSLTVARVGGAVIFLAVLLLGMPGYGLLHRRLTRRRKVLVSVGSEGLTVNTRPDEVFPFGDARVGHWTLEGDRRSIKGTALHLGTDGHRFVLGGRDHRLGAGIFSEATPVDNVDAWIWAAEFDEILTIIGRRCGTQTGNPIPAQPIRCLLIPNAARSFSSSVFGMFKNTATALRLNSNPSQAQLAFDIGEDAISVIDLATNARITSAPLRHVKVIAAASTRSMPRIGPMTTPVLIVTVPGTRRFTIGCPNLDGAPLYTLTGKTRLHYRFSWVGEVTVEEEPAFVVSDPDWLTLVDKFGLAPRLADGAKEVATEAALAQPKRKRWIYAAIVAPILLIAASAMMLLGGSITNDRQLKDELLKADSLRQFALPFADLRMPHGVTVDASGNVYVSDTHTNRVLKLAPGASTETVLPFDGLDLCPDDIAATTASVASDTTGAVYVSDSCHDRVVKLAPGSSTQTVVPFIGMESPQGVAVDTAGTAYVVDYSHAKILKLAPGASEATALPPMGNVEPSGAVAVDTAGDIYISCSRRRTRQSCLMKLPAGSSSWTRLPSTSEHAGDSFSSGEQDVAVDASGTVYMICSKAVMKLAPGTNTWVALRAVPSLIDPVGLAVDPRGDYVYVTDHVGSRATESVFPWEKDDAQGFVLKIPTG